MVHDYLVSCPSLRIENFHTHSPCRRGDELVEGRAHFNILQIRISEDEWQLQISHSLLQ